MNAAAVMSRLRRRGPAAICFLCAIGGLGCPAVPGVAPQPPPGPPRQPADIISVIERNNAMLDRAIWSKSVTVTARFKDDKSKEHVYNLEGSFLFRGPRCLRLDLRPGMGEQVMQIGSNDEDYWVWIEPEIKAMRWGRHRNVGKDCSGNIVIRPDQLSAALGLCGLPGPEEGLIGPARKYGKTHDILYYVKPQPTGDCLLEREYWVDRSPPYLIRLVLYRDGLGRVAMSAFLDDYRQAWENGPQIARSVSIIWPKDDGKFTMSIGELRGLPPENVGPRAFVRPQPSDLPRGVEQVIQVDADCDLTANEPAGGEAG